MAKSEIDWQSDEGQIQLANLISYHQDLAEQCLAHRRIAEQTIEELTVKVLKMVARKGS
jgi:hypothetical protein